MSSDIFHVKSARLPQWLKAACTMLLLASAFSSTPVAAQIFTAAADWKETDVPPPPAYDMAKLLSFEVARSSSLVYGVDPASFSISKSDGIVRYVVVASSPGGAKNAMYEGLRCATAEVKTYARANLNGTWVAVENSEWKSLYDPAVPRHSLRFAKAGACDSAAPVSTVRELVKKLTAPEAGSPG